MDFLYFLIYPLYPWQVGVVDHIILLLEDYKKYANKKTKLKANKKSKNSQLMLAGTEMGHASQLNLNQTEIYLSRIACPKPGSDFSEWM